MSIMCRPVAARDRRTLVLATGTLAALAVAGCATLRVGSMVEPSADVPSYRTYAWTPAGALSTGDPRLDNNELFDARVRAIVDRELAARGFAMAAPPAADVLVHYHLSVTQEIDVREIDREYHGSAGLATYRPYVYEAGTLFIDLVEARSNRLVWRGWAEGSLDGVIENQAWLESRIDDSVRQILRRLRSGKEEG